MSELDALTRAHMHLHQALARINCFHRLALVPFLGGLFAAMAWWGSGQPGTWQPVVIIGTALATYAMIAVASVGRSHAMDAARQLTAHHEQQLDNETRREGITADA